MAASVGKRYSRGRKNFQWGAVTVMNFSSILRRMSCHFKRGLGLSFGIGILSVGVLSSGCSSLAGATGSAPSAAAGAPRGELALDLFAARGFLGGSDYERYHISGDVLWRECGKVQPNKRAASQKSPTEGDSIFREDPQLEITQRRIEHLSAEQLGALKLKSQELLTSIAATSPATPPPGSVFSLAAPGLLELSVTLGKNKERVVTSVDAVSEQETESLSGVYRLFAALRGIGPEICSARTFFGIGKSE